MRRGLGAVIHRDEGGQGVAPFGLRVRYRVTVWLRRGPWWGGYV